ncbi:MAG: hypothetical protein ABI744_07800 [Chloroflexota bacterium]
MRDSGWEARHQRAVAENLQIDALLRAELTSQGCNVVGNLGQVDVAPNDVPTFLRVMIDAVSRDYSANVKQMIAGAIHQVDASSVWDELADVYRRESGLTKELLGGILSRDVGDESIGQLVELLHSTEEAGARAMLLSVFAPYRGNSIARRRRLLRLIRPEVERYADDPEIGPTIRDAIDRIDRYEAKLAKRH